MKIKKAKGRVTAKNPYVRLRESLDLTQEAVALRCGVSRNYVIRCEQGTYPETTNRLATYLIEEAGESYTEFEEEYDEFQRETRMDALDRGVLCEVFPETYGDLVIGEHPFSYWAHVSHKAASDRNDDRDKIVSLTSLCTAFCLPQAVVWKWVSTPYRVKTVPGEVLSALREAGYSSLTLKDLESAYAKFLKHRLEVSKQLTLEKAAK